MRAKKYKWTALLVLMIGLMQSRVDASQRVHVMVSPKASSTERIAGEELAVKLGKLYPLDTFSVVGQPGNLSDYTILLGTPESIPGFSKSRLQGPESYLVEAKGREAAIVGYDPAGVMYGVIRLLEALDFGFFLSGDTMPEPKTEPFGFDGWELEDHPLTPLRISFNWHNFLSSCSTWDLADWKEWIAQSQKVGYNTIMVHAYGNNPMFSYTFNSRKKPVGKLATTRSGRDWAVNHVNDVRRIQGGELFERDFFGSDAVADPSLPQSETVPAMMSKAFAYADKRGVDVNIAIDIDMPSCLPQKLITTLDEEDRYQVYYVGHEAWKIPAGNLWVARPDTEDGYAFYKAQCDALLDSYPTLDTITIWRRGGNSPLLNTKLEEFPQSWQDEYNAYLEEHPDIKWKKQLTPMFGIAKIYKAWQRALKDAGREDIELAFGCWNADWIPGSEEFLPKDTRLIALDSRLLYKKGFMNKPEQLKKLAESIGPDRFIPIIWSHHDDGAYIGSPLEFLPHFSDLMELCDAPGYGVIHWMTHPLDPYYTGHERQVWANTKNESQEDTCRFVARRWFGAKNERLMTEYVNSWLSDMPAFSRETSELFIDHELGPDLEKVRAGYAQRMKLLEGADRSAMSESQLKQHRFFIDYEKYVLGVYETQTAFEQAIKAFEAGDLTKARELVRPLAPETVVADYAHTLKENGTTKGESGFVVSMNTRWVPHYERLRQQLGLEAVRYNFGVTDHEPLAQARGQLTLHYSKDKTMWQTFGTEETGIEIISLEGGHAGSLPEKLQEICSESLISEKTIELYVSPILSKGCSASTKIFDEFAPQEMPAGNYTLTLWFHSPEASVMDLNVTVDAAQVFSKEITLGAKHMLEQSIEVALAKPTVLKLTLKPTQGNAAISGLILVPDQNK